MKRYDRQRKKPKAIDQGLFFGLILMCEKKIMGISYHIVMAFQVKQTIQSVNLHISFSPLSGIPTVERHLCDSLASTLNWIDLTQERDDPCPVSIWSRRDYKGQRVFRGSRYHREKGVNCI